MAQLQRLVVQPDQFQQQRILLTHEQQHYLQRVLRLSVGDRFIAMDGRGQSWLAQIVIPEFQAEVLEAVTSQTELPVTVTLVAALPKGNGFDDVVRQVTELGVTQIEPVISERTLLKPGPQKWERWQRIAHEAAEQSERQTVPLIQEPKPFTNHLQQAGTLPGNKYLCATRGNFPHLLSCLSSIPDCRHPTPNSITIAIGPEGGWTEAEVEQAISAGYQPVSLGCRILRAVTAPIVALSLIAAVYEQ